MVKMKKKMLLTTLAGVMALSLAACTSTGGSSGGKAGEADYPKKPVTITVPSGAGGGIDTAARLMSKVLAQTELVAQPITVENKPGGGQVTGTVDFVQNDKGDDYKMLLVSTNLVLNNLKKDGNNPYSFRDITPIAQLVTENNVIAVAADSKYNNLQELFADMKADPSSIVVAGGSAPGSFDHLNVIIPAKAAGVDAKSIKYLSFDGGGEALTSLLGGSAQVLSSDLYSVYEFVKAGQAKILGVSAAERLEGEFADIPTYKEQGFDAVLVNWRGIFGPADMSESAKAYWDEKVKALVETEEWKAELETLGWEQGYLPSEEFVKELEAQDAMYKEVYTGLGMQK